MKLFYYLLLISYFLLSACSLSKQISNSANKILRNDSAISTGHIGISIFEPSTGKYWYNYQSEKYFVPASNTKLFSLYAGMKYLGDSLPGIKYAFKNDTLFILPTGDPTFLNSEFSQQNIFSFLKRSNKPVAILKNNWREDALGYGWSWDDYGSTDMIERSSLPIYSNLVKFTQVKDKNGKFVFTEPDVNWKINFSDDTTHNKFSVARDRSQNIYQISFGNENRKVESLPFVTHGVQSAVSLLHDTLGLDVFESSSARDINFTVLHSQPVDSLYTIMMHRSDNFFAEQTLLMAANEKIGYMNDENMISALLKTDLKDIPQRPKWVDGSGLSRYNLFTPRDFVFILNKLQSEFGLERIKKILPTGGTGTLKLYYKNDSNFIFAKTGTLSNHVALSGFLITKKKKLLIFSILVNNFQNGATPVRKAIEKFITGIRQRW